MKKTLEKAVTSALPEGKEAYFFVPILLWHINGKCYGVFGSANEALAWQRGVSDLSRKFFYLTDDQCRRVILQDNPSHPDHASAILDTLTKQEDNEKRTE